MLFFMNASGASIPNATAFNHDFSFLSTFNIREMSELLKKPNHRAKYVPSMQESARSADTCVYNAALLRPRGYSGQATHNSKGEQLADIEAPYVKIINS